MPQLHDVPIDVDAPKRLLAGVGREEEYARCATVVATAHFAGFERPDFVNTAFSVARLEATEVVVGSNANA